MSPASDKILSKGKEMIDFLIGAFLGIVCGIALSVAIIAKAIRGGAEYYKDSE
jgi:hypothetical protein